MKAALRLKSSQYPEDNFPSDAEVIHYLNEQKINTGIDDEAIFKWCEDEHRDNEIIVANGIVPIHGKNGYLKSNLLSEDEKKKDSDSIESLNLRDVLHIPSVHAGQKIASIIPPVNGVEGKNVYGVTVPAKPGKPYRLRPGKNIEMENNAIYATIDGQIHFGERIINVFPSYEVSGDLDMKTGNIDFVGNVVIRGNVPTGYVIKAKGDIKIFGLVEGAELNAEGSILVTGGIAAANKGEVHAGVDIHASYINQANVHAAHNIIVQSSIFHSQCIAGDEVLCNEGNIVGGSVSAGKKIIANNIGNRMNTHTDLYLGMNETLLLRQKETEKLLSETNQTIENLALIEAKLKEKEKKKGLTNAETKLFQRQKQTYHSMIEQQKILEESLHSFKHDSIDFGSILIEVKDSLFPNVIMHFGKYQRNVQVKHSNVQFSLIDKEITFSPLS
ncbi:hypothetical protein BFG57_06620 [Bacillus solimangrovi]|uniref:Flagellar Assembly Protein A N-terminal region domain-containing protein n=2 Tax=Bacillus solimangrovi TaxID=1305675 RepID=A0A1E5LB45_9BACI|nr:hypothetical protein BFG57_06620 [Bacillus solimangrovi]